MKRLYLLTIIGLLFCACHLNAQEVVTMQQLEGTKWQMKKPNNKMLTPISSFLTDTSLAFQTSITQILSLERDSNISTSTSTCII